MFKHVLVPLAAGCVILALTGFEVQKQKKDDTKKTTGKKAAVAPASTSPVSYKKDVFPVLKKYCLPCHTEEEMNPSQLYLDTYENMAAGGKHGKPFIPGKADSSLVVLKLSGKAAFGDQMPLKRKTPFPEDTLTILKKWIEQGAKKN